MSATLNIQKKLAQVNAARTRLTEVINESEEAFIANVGIKDAGAIKKAGGYFEKLQLDKSRLMYLDKLCKDLLAEEKLIAKEVEKPVTHTVTKEWNKSNA